MNDRSAPDLEAWLEDSAIGAEDTKDCRLSNLANPEQNSDLIQHVSCQF